LVVVALTMKCLTFILLALACRSAASAVVLPKPEAAFGLFYTPSTLYPYERLYFEDMKRHGCNTLAPQVRPLAGQTDASAASGLARMVNTAAEVGLLDTRFPVVCYSVGPADVVGALALRKPGLQWPELVVQSIDEPNQSQEATLKQYQLDAHAAGLRIGTAVAGYGCTGYKQQLPWCKPEDAGKPVPGIGQYLDLWIVLVGTLTTDVQDKARQQGAEVGGYLAYPSSPLLDRFTFGLWAWKAKTRTNLLWAYLNKQEGWDYSRVVETPTGPVDPPGGCGYAEGITDYRVLQAVRDLHTKRGDEFLRRMDALTPLGWWPRGYVAERQADEKPTMDLDRVRRQGLRLLGAKP
jgi:hypothetical protein